MNNVSRGRDKVENYPGNQMMNRIVHGEIKAFKRGKPIKGAALAGLARGAGVVNIIGGIIVVPVMIGGCLVVGGVALGGAVVTSPLLIPKKTRAIPLTCAGVGFGGLGIGVIGGIAGAVVLATSPLTQIVAPELTYG